MKLRKQCRHGWYVGRLKSSTLSPSGMTMSRPKAPNGSGKVTVHGYRLIMVDGKELKEHRMVLAAVHGWEALEGMDVHHLNGDKLDNRIENLILVTPSDHIRLYHPYPNQYPAEHWEAIAEVYRNGGRKPVVAVAESFGVSYSQATKWVQRTRLKGVLPPGQNKRGSRMRKGL